MSDRKYSRLSEPVAMDALLNAVGCLSAIKRSCSFINLRMSVSCSLVMPQASFDELSCMLILFARRCGIVTNFVKTLEHGQLYFTRYAHSPLPQ